MVLFAHDREAYRAASVMLPETGKAAAIHPTGKSFLVFSLSAAPPEVDRLRWISSLRRNPLESTAKAALANLEAPVPFAGHGCGEFETKGT